MEYAGALYHNAYVILPNHYHLALETPEANLVAGIAGCRTHTRGVIMVVISSGGMCLAGDTSHWWWMAGMSNIFDVCWNIFILP